MKTILLYVKRDNQKADEVAKDISTYLSSKNIESIYADSTLSLKNENIDLVIVVGGDGTFLAAARFLNENISSKSNYKDELPPILGVNMGSLGFLTECRVEEVNEVIEKGLKHGFTTEDREMFDVNISGKSTQGTFLNDAVINRCDTARIMDFDISYNSEYISNVKADGVIISSPTGSTAYSLAAGGPIMHPEISAVAITPISPHTLTNRPIVVSDKGTVEVKVNTEQNVQVTLDGQSTFKCEKDDVVSIKKHERYLKIVRPYKTTYFNILRNKLSFGRRG